MVLSIKPKLMKSRSVDAFLNIYTIQGNGLNLNSMIDRFFFEQCDERRFNCELTCKIFVSWDMGWVQYTAEIRAVVSAMGHTPTPRHRRSSKDGGSSIEGHVSCQISLPFRWRCCALCPGMLLVFSINFLAYSLIGIIFEWKTRFQLLKKDFFFLDL